MNIVRAISVVVVTFALDVSATQADPAPEVPAKAIEAMGFLLGDWEAENYENGEKIGASKDCRTWADGGHCLKISWKGTDRGGEWQADAVAGWDAQDNALIEYWFGNQGQSLKNRYPLDKMTENTWDGDFTFVTRERVVMQGTCRVTKTADGFVYESTCTQDDEELVFKSVTRRFKDVSTAGVGEVSPDQVLKYFPGNWEWTQSDGESGTVHWELVSDGAALAGMGTTTYGGKDFGMGGWVPEEKKWVHTWYSAKGHHGRMEWTSFSGDTYTGTARVGQPGAEAVDAKVTCKIVDENSFVLAMEPGHVTKWKRTSIESHPVDANLKKLEPLIGSWDVVFDSPVVSFKEAHVTYRWAMGGRYLEARWTLPDGTYLGPELFVWDPNRQAVRMWGFDVDSFYEATWRIDGTSWTCIFDGWRLAGDRVHSNVEMKFKDDGSIVATFTPVGTQKPDGTVTFRRAHEKR